MRESTQKVLKLFFNPGETISISPNKYAYHSVEQNSLNGFIDLISPNPSVAPAQIREEDILLLTVNPVLGFRSDSNVTAYRSFLVEIDDGSLAKQREYIDSMGLPYSICVFSGNKSLHYGIVLDEDLPDYDIWRLYAEWILNIITRADQLTKNPSRNIRFPNNKRTDGRQLVQSLIELKQRVRLNDLNIWLNKFPESKPKPPAPPRVFNQIPTPLDVPEWILNELNNGIMSNRNATWFRIAGNLARRNFGEDDIINILEPYFIEDHDFQRKEWVTTIKSGIKGAFKGNL